MQKYTVSYHNGSKISRAHNNRTGDFCRCEEHIDLSREHENWRDESIAQAYQRIFEADFRAYNEKQRKDRQCKSYLDKIQADSQKKALYEVIITIGDKDDHPDPIDAKRALKTFFVEWQKKNGRSLEVVGAYYHDDEEGAPHLHLDYIPVARNCKRGQKTQNSLTKALEQLGYVTGNGKTAQIAWQDDNRALLEQVVSRTLGCQIRHKNENRQHYDTEKFKVWKNRQSTKVLDKLLYNVDAVADSPTQSNRYEVKQQIKKAFTALVDLLDDKKHVENIKKARKDIEFDTH